MSETVPSKKKWPRYRGYSRLIKSGNSGNLSVGSDLMSVLSEGMLFKPELTKDGILFRITDENKMTPDDKPLPTWVKPKAKTAKIAAPSVSAIENTDDDNADDAIADDNADDDAPVEDVDAEDEPPTDDDTPF